MTNTVSRLSTPGKKVIVSILICALLITLLFTLSYGQVYIEIPVLFDTLITNDRNSAYAKVLWDIRIPRVVTAMVAGAAMGIGGVLMQALFRNPMADAWSLGLLAGGQLGVALVVAATALAGPAAVSFLEVFEGIGLTSGAMLGIALFATAMLTLSRKVGVITLLVVGLMLGFTVQGIVSIVMHFANRIGGRLYSGWNDGTFASTTPEDLLWICIPVIVGVLLAISIAKNLSNLLLGETYARSLGTDVKSLRRKTLAAVVLLVAPVTAFCGPITFIGLIVPHFARAIARSSKVISLIPLAALCGALLALSADTLVNLPWQQHFLHLNAVLALVGAPVVIGLLVFSKTARGGE